MVTLPRNLVRADALGERPLVGRTSELAILDRLLAEGSPRMRVTLVEGEPGIGKTRLVAAFLDGARRHGFRVLRGSCYPVAEAGPYFPVLQVLSQLRPLALSLEEFSEPTSEADARAMLPGDVRGKRARYVRRLADALLRANEGHKTVLCVEDIHWADVGSLLVLNDLLDAGDPGLVIACTARSGEPMEAGARQLFNRVAQRSSLLELRGLSSGEVAELVASLASFEHVSPEELHALSEFTGGNPLFVTELVRHLRESDLLRRYRMPEAIAHIRIPPNLADLIDLRLDRLREPVAAAVSAASVIGPEPSLRLIAELLGASADDAEPLLAEAAEQQIVSPQGTWAEPSFRFAHPLIERRLYDRLPSTSRRAFHRKIAEAAASGTISLRPEDLARHCAIGLGRAGGRRAIAHCQAAAERAERLLAYESAAHYWEFGLKCALPKWADVRAELHTRHGRALWAAGNWAQAHAAWELAVDLYEAAGRKERAATVALALADMLRWRSELDGAERWLTRALDLGLPSSADRGRALAILGGIQRFRGNPKGLETLQEAERLIGVEHADPTTVYWLSYGFLVGGQRSRALALARAGLDEAQRRSDSSATTLLAASLFNHELAELNVDAAERFAEVAHEAASPADPAALIRSLLCAALLGGYKGDWNRVAAVCEEWMSKVRLASRFQVATASLFWAEARFVLGDHENAESITRSALADMAEMEPIAGLHLARMVAIQGRHEEAVKLLSEYSSAVLPNPRSTAAAGRAVLGEVATLVGDESLCGLCYDVLIQEPRPLVTAYSPVSVQRVLGRLAAALSRWPQAIERFETAMDQLTAAGARWELASTYLDYAQMRWLRGRRGDAGKAAALELKAEAIFMELGIASPAHRAPPPVHRDGNRYGLTSRELEVLALVASGMRNQEIAERLVISRGTVNRHLENILTKVGVRTRTEAVVLAVRDNLVSPPR